MSPISAPALERLDTLKSSFPFLFFPFLSVPLLPLDLRHPCCSCFLFSEGARNKSCDSENGGCEQNCTTVDGAVVCECWSGFQLSVDTRKCMDIDECQTFGACSQLCVNTRGSYKCQCELGYVSVGVNSKHCKAQGAFKNPYCLHKSQCRALATPLFLFLIMGLKARNVLFRFLSEHGRKPEQNILHARSVVCPSFLK